MQTDTHLHNLPVVVTPPPTGVKTINCKT